MQRTKIFKLMNKLLTKFNGYDSFKLFLWHFELSFDDSI